MSDWIAKLAKKSVFLWDFDGCFADTERLHFLAYSKAFAQFGHQIDERQYYETFSHLGLGAKKEIEYYGLSCTVEQITAAKPALYWDLVSGGKAKVFSEMGPIVKILKQRGKVAIASNSPKEELDEILSGNPDVPTLDLVLGLTPGLRKKPAPDLFLKALELLNARAADAVVFEDSDRGLAAAAAAGCDAIWVQTPYNERFSTKWPTIARVTHADLLKQLKTI